LKKHLILGSGADTFAIAFPQQDYVGIYNAGFDSQFVSKPHNMYLQMGVQTGVLSLIAFLVFYGMYFISSIRLYIKGHFNSYFAQIGVGVFVGTFGYMITGIANDSTIAVAPMFWTLMGLGIAINYKVKSIVSIKDKR
jgi:O-antigen ligase